MRNSRRRSPKLDVDFCACMALRRSGTSLALSRRADATQTQRRRCIARFRPFNETVEDSRDSSQQHTSVCSRSTNLVGGLRRKPAGRWNGRCGDYCPARKREAVPRSDATVSGNRYRHFEYKRRLECEWHRRGKCGFWHDFERGLVYGAVDPSGKYERSGYSHKHCRCSSEFVGERHANR